MPAAAPRPILKGLSFVSSSDTSSSNPLPFSSCPTIFDTPHVHFPPTPTLTSTENTHSSFMYDRAPIVVTPNVCALPERGGRMFFGNSNGNGNQGGLGAGGGGYFHPHAKFQVNAAVRVVERGDSGVETVSVSSSPTIFSASVTVGNVVVNNECGSVELLTMKTKKKKKRHSGSIIYDYDYDASDSSDLGVFYSPPSPCIPPTTPSPSTSTSSSSSSSIIPHSSLCISPRNVYNSNNNNNNTSTATSSPSPAAGSSNKKRLKNRQNRVEGGGEGGGGGCDRNKRTKLLTPGGLDSYSTSPGFELEGCLGGF